MTPLAIAGHFPELPPYPRAKGLGAKVEDRRDPLTRARAIAAVNLARGRSRLTPKKTAEEKRATKRRYEQANRAERLEAQKLKRAAQRA